MTAITEAVPPSVLYGPLSSEPPAASGVTRVSVRSCSGRASARRFLCSDPVRALFSFAVSLDEQAAGGRSFLLLGIVSPLAADGPPGSGQLVDLSEGRVADLSIAQAGLQNSQVIMRWAE